MRIERKGKIIRSLTDWRCSAPPKSSEHWIEGRSAFELARAWCVDELPTAVQILFESHPRTRGMVVDVVIPEHQIFFDAHGGEPRNADLAFVGRTANETVAVTVEGKADEAFGGTVAETIATALERAIKNHRSRGVRRIEDLVQALLTAKTKEVQHVANLRYQLLTAAAGSLAFAYDQHASIAVLLVQEFVTEKTTDKLHERNEKDYEAFLCRLAGRPEIEGNLPKLRGPFPVPGGKLFANPAPLFVGKITTNLRDPS